MFPSYHCWHPAASFRSDLKQALVRDGAGAIFFDERQLTGVRTENEFDRVGGYGLADHSGMSDATGLGHVDHPFWAIRRSRNTPVPWCD